MVSLSAIQLTSSPDVNENLLVIEQQLQQLPSIAVGDEHIVVLPECCLFFGAKEQSQLTLARASQQKQRLQKALAQLALKYQLYLVAGTIPILTAAADKFTNSCCVFAPNGEQLAQYDKIHLFDVAVADNAKTYLESRYTQAGDQVKLVDTASTRLGLSVCYDLRFPELFRQLQQQGADIICLPSAFTKVTGQAHWQALLQARAIENQVYIIAAGQEGEHANGRQTWGHSMIINPWGEILACLETGAGFVTAQFDRDEMAKIRTSMPVSAHNQFKTELISYE